MTAGFVDIGLAHGYQTEWILIGCLDNRFENSARLLNARCEKCISKSNQTRSSFL